MPSIGRLICLGSGMCHLFFHSKWNMRLPVAEGQWGVPNAFT